MEPPRKSLRLSKGKKVNNEDENVDLMDDKQLKRKKPIPAEASTSSQAEVNGIELNDLPNEILIHIFWHLNADERKTASQVSKRWLDLIFSRGLAKDFPLTFDHCLFRPRFPPRTLFNKTKAYRQFPYIHIGMVQARTPYEGYYNNVVDEAKLPEFYKVMKRIGGHTTHLTLTSAGQKSIMGCFPQLAEVQIDKLESIVDYDEIPQSLHTIVATRVNNNMESKVIDYLKELKQIKTVKCKYMQLRPDPKIKRWFTPTNQKDLPVFKEISKDLNAVLDKEKGIFAQVKTSANLLSNTPIDFDDITGIELDENFVNYGELLKFNNLEEIKLKTNSCFKFHKELKFPGVTRFKLRMRYYSSNKGICDVCFMNIISSFDGLKVLSLFPSVSDQQMKQIFETQTKLERLTVNYTQFDSATFVSSDGSNAKYLGIMAKLEKLKVVSSGEFDYELPWFDRETLRNWPPMPRVKKLQIGCFHSSNTRNIPAPIELGILIARCPNVQHFSIQAEYLSRDNFASIARGWPNLLSLNVDLTEDDLEIDSFKHVSDQFKRLQLLKIRSYNDWDERNLKFELNLYQKIETLREIQLESESDGEISKYGSYRELYFDRHQQRKLAKENAIREYMQNYWGDADSSDTDEDDEDEEGDRYLLQF